MDGSIIVSIDFGLGNVAAMAFINISPSVTLLGFPLSALTLLVGQQEGHLACKK